jgi:SAM-dependent methyltransferase
MLVEYYRKRAEDYDSLYASAAWQPDLAHLRDWLIAQVSGRTVLEIAAGTGHWTAIAARAAKAITATDVNPEMLAVAATKGLGAHVILAQADCWSLPSFSSAFEVGMAHLWWSHVRRQDRGRLLTYFASHLQPCATLLMIDQIRVPDFGVPISRRDEAGNTYERRWLDDGEAFEIVKNYPDEGELADSVGEACDEVDILQLTWFWALRARFRRARPSPASGRGCNKLTTAPPPLPAPDSSPERHTTRASAA